MATIVIRSRSKEKISGSFTFEWSVHTFHRLKNGELIAKNKLIDRAKALKIIESKGLVEAIRTKDGEIYDTPEGDFKALFPDGIRTKADNEAIEKTDKL